MAHLTQMAGLAVQNFVSAAVGIAVAIALIRGIVRRRANTIGNFWVDLTRVSLRVLLPLSLVIAVVLVSQGAVQNLSGFTPAHTVEGVVQSIPGGPVASQEAIKELGTPLHDPDQAQVGARSGSSTVFLTEPGMGYRFQNEAADGSESS
jgi:potassium-transporting ATPase potassium-binding subunit